jgi:hypothetical protein
MHGSPLLEVPLSSFSAHHRCEKQVPGGWCTHARACGSLLACVFACAVLVACGERTGSTAAETTDPATHIGGRPATEFYSARDRFPSVESPGTVAAQEAGWLDPQDEVLGVVLGRHVRAYPTTMIAYHHVVNDTIGEAPVLVTYCVLCSAAVAFDPRLDGTRLTFGMEGSWRGTATMYDHQTGSLWLQLTGECLSGAHAGRRLAGIASARHTTWSDWRRLHPDTEVMARRAENVRPGERYPERAPTGLPYVPPELASIMVTEDKRLAPHALLYGIELDGVARAYPIARLQAQPVVNERIGSVDVTIWFNPASRSTAAFHRLVGEQHLEFRAAHGGVEDVETGSRWTMDGRCVEGALRGTSLRPVHGFLSEWYGWSVLRPETTIRGT